MHERALLDVLKKHLPESWEIYERPYLNGDFPDMVLLHPRIGFQIINLVLWEEGEVHIDSTDTHSDRTLTYVRARADLKEVVANPITRLRSHRNNILNNYIPELGESVDKNTALLKLLTLALYFPLMKTDEARMLVQDRYIVVFGSDGIQEHHSFRHIVPNITFTPRTDLTLPPDWADKARAWLAPSIHHKEMNDPLPLNKEQRRYATNADNARRQRIRGVSGSGKSLIVAQRAANLAEQGKQVLIMTYNVTLCNYLLALTERTQNNFERTLLEFRHFHGFCSSVIHAADRIWPQLSSDDEQTKSDMFDTLIPAMLIQIAQKDATRRRYGAILIDEGQDFIQAWFDALLPFLAEDGQILLVADENQNIYERAVRWTDHKMIGGDFGKWAELKVSYRVPPAILNKMIQFLKTFMPDFERTGLIPIPPEMSQTKFGWNPHHVWKEVRSYAETAYALLMAVQWLQKQGRTLDTMVILVTTNGEGTALVEHFQHAHIPVNHIFKADEHEWNSVKTQNKRNFYVGDPRLKICTYHSFKGWEANNIFVVVSEKHVDHSLLYVALTRTTENLFVLNRNPVYQEYGSRWPRDWDGTDIFDDSTTG